MAFWMAILVGVLFVWLAVRLGFYETWVLFFNTVISIYLSVFLAPILVEVAPAPGGAISYHTALCLLILAGGCFAILQGLSYVFLTGQYHIPFPRVFDIVLSGVVGFGTGFLIMSFVSLALTTTPLGQHKILGVFGVSQPSRQTQGPPTRDLAFGSPNLACLTRCCDVIHAFARFGNAGNTTEAAMRKLLEAAEAHLTASPARPDVNEPPKPLPPQETKPRTSRRLPEAEFQ
jgi:hypothetical protein